jgi:hypothetical protein
MSNNEALIIAYKAEAGCWDRLARQYRVDGNHEKAKSAWKKVDFWEAKAKSLTRI